MRRLLVVFFSLLPTIGFAQRGGFSGGGAPLGGFRPLHSGGSGGGGSDGLPLILGIIGVMAVVLAVGYRRARQFVGNLRITAPPPGEAPDEIRQAWVGVAIPLRRGHSRPVTQASVGVLSKTMTEPTTGYALMGSEAIAALETHNPGAAQWWRDNAPQVLAPGYVLLFPTDICTVELLPTA